MKRCLDVMVVEGIKTNIPLHRRILEDPDFLAGRIDTGFMERFMPREEGRRDTVSAGAAAAAAPPEPAWTRWLPLLHSSTWSATGPSPAWRPLARSAP